MHLNGENDSHEGGVEVKEEQSRNETKALEDRQKESLWWAPMTRMAGEARQRMKLSDGNGDW